MCSLLHGLLYNRLFFDAALVQEYRSYKDSSLDAEYRWCRNESSNPEVLPTITCEEEIFSQMSFACTPLKFNAISRFNYSLVFVIMPWIFYFIEFLFSSYMEDMKKVQTCLCC